MPEENPLLSQHQPSQYTKARTFFLLLVVGIIIGAIWYLDHGKVDVRGTHIQAVNVTTVDQLATSTILSTGDTALASSTTGAPVSKGKSATKTPDQIKSALMQLAQSDKSAGYSVAKEITDPTGFINTGTDSTGNPLQITISQYVGKKVVMIDFWTYSCINCQRTTPYLNAWYDKYEGDGFVIIGVHTPEFDFEKVYANVMAAVKKEGITYPVVMDSNYGTWTAYGNQYWPHKYLIDMAGYVVYDQIGEGQYAETEQKIQDALAQRNQILGITTPVPTGIVNPSDAVTTIQTQSPETYFGSARNEYLGNGQQSTTGTQTLSLPTTFEDNTLYLGGTWNFQSQEADAQGDDSIVYHFNAKELYFVAGSANANGTDIEVLLDGKPVPASELGSDVKVVDGKTMAHITGDTLYHLIDLPDMEEHTVQIHTGAGLKAFTFTFG